MGGMNRTRWALNVATRGAIGVVALGLLGWALSGCTPTSTTGSTASCRWPPALGRPAMPTPERLKTTVSYSFNHVRLYPPPAAVHPIVSAAQAWNAPKDLQTWTTYKLVLAEWNSTDPPVPGRYSTDRLLVWVVMGRHVEVGELTRANKVRAGGCIYESAMWPVSAQTGEAFGEVTFPSSGATVLH